VIPSPFAIYRKIREILKVIRVIQIGLYKNYISKTSVQIYINIAIDREVYLDTKY